MTNHTHTIMLNRRTWRGQSTQAGNWRLPFPWCAMV